MANIVHEAPMMVKGIEKSIISDILTEWNVKSIKNTATIIAPIIRSAEDLNCFSNFIYCIKSYDILILYMKR